MITEDVKRRFLVKVLVAGPGECWPWIGGKSNGRGMIRIRGKQVFASRVAYEIATGQTPGDLWVLHRCDNPVCCNPEHLFLGTHQDNVDDSVRKKRHSHGKKVGTSKLDEKAVQSILARYRPGLGGALAREYGVTPQTIHLIVRKVSWRHVEGANPPVGYARGSDNGTGKLTEDKVRRARQLRNEGWTWKELAEDANVTIMTIRAACLRLTWWHVE